MASTKEKWLEIYDQWAKLKSSIETTNRAYSEWFTQEFDNADVALDVERVRQAISQTGGYLDDFAKESDEIRTKIGAARPGDWEGSKRREMWEAARDDAQAMDFQFDHDKFREAAEKALQLGPSAAEDKTVEDEFNEAVYRTFDSVGSIYQRTIGRRGLDALENPGSLSLMKKLRPH